MKKRHNHKLTLNKNNISLDCMFKIGGINNHIIFITISCIVNQLGIEIKKKKNAKKKKNKEGYDKTPSFPSIQMEPCRTYFGQPPTPHRRFLYKNNRFATLLQGNLKFHFIYHNKNTIY